MGYVSMQDMMKIIEQTVSGLGYDIVDIENTPKILRIYIDTLTAESSINIDDCVSVSNQLTRIFEVENIDYNRLEVSTPGIDRPLKTYAHYIKFIGHEACVTFRQPLENKKRYTGIILEPKNEQTLCLKVDNKQGEFVIDFTVDEVEKAKLSLEPYFPKSQKEKKENSKKQ
ncbi:MAG: hypothetical protein RLZZ210_663 [Pseudomonadota bacterium]|jgi:ribosome maturation factor RimP